MTSLSDRQRGLREAFLEVVGYWNDSWQALLEMDPGFFEAYLGMARLPAERRHLSAKTRELIGLVVDSAATHLYTPGIREHIRRALELGATKAELMEVLELTATLGIHACNLGVPILVEELERAGGPLDRTLTARQREIQKEFAEKRGYWNSFWDEMLLMDPEFFKAYTDFSSVPWTDGVLEPKVKELVYTAFDASATHLYGLGLRAHVQNALGYGATKEEIMEVFLLASQIGVHACNLGVPILVEELAGLTAADR